MNSTVSLVQAYLRLNGYFTVSEYPILATAAPGKVQTITDIDLMAFRFPRTSTPLVPAKQNRQGRNMRSRTTQDCPDPKLEIPDSHGDMIIAEVKEGAARLNPNATDPAVLEAALVRFGCCGQDIAANIVSRLAADGTALGPHGHVIRLMIFASWNEHKSHHHVKMIPLSHVIQYLQHFLEDNWNLLRHTQLSEPGLDLLITLKKASSHSSH